MLLNKWHKWATMHNSTELSQNPYICGTSRLQSSLTFQVTTHHTSHLAPSRHKIHLLEMTLRSLVSPIFEEKKTESKVAKVTNVQVKVRVWKSDTAMFSSSSGWVESHSLMGQAFDWIARCVFETRVKKWSETFRNGGRPSKVNGRSGLCDWLVQ